MHPNLVTLMGICSEAPALVYEFLPNGSLENHLSGKNDTPPLTWQIRTRIISEICKALIFLHSNKPDLVVHGDLKPDNILLDANFVCKLGDFGISHLIKQIGTNTAVERTYNPRETVAYMDPELAAFGEVSLKCDIYSFGIVILRLVTGMAPVNIAAQVQEAMNENSFHKMIDECAGKWPIDLATQLANIGVSCADRFGHNRLNLVSVVWPIIETMMKSTLEIVPCLSLSCTLSFISSTSQESMEDSPDATDGSPASTQRQ